MSYRARENGPLNIQNTRQLVFQKEYVSNKRPVTTFNPGDLVMVRNRQQGSFVPKWTGPWEVISRTESEEEYEFSEDMARTADPIATPVPAPSHQEEPRPGTSPELTDAESRALNQISAVLARSHHQRQQLLELTKAPTLRETEAAMEQLTRLMLSLDAINTEGSLIVRHARKKAIQELE
ncbi:hypothetical protein HUJ05_009742 [Dendroctonus ponderosae]|nr:hypothetical protein HUJ05_009742 [Dendroctonus ponderosae]